MDVTDQVLRTHEIYGGSDSTRNTYAAASKTFNYVVGNSWQCPDEEIVDAIPKQLTYQNETGLFGAENYFIRVNTNITMQLFFKDDTHVVNGYYDARIRTVTDEDFRYEPVTGSNDEELDPKYEAAIVTLGTELPQLSQNSYVSVDLANLKTGNKYIDSWLDVRLYNKQREEHPYDKGYVRVIDQFYLGIHARNTRKLPYNITLDVGREYLDYEDIPTSERRYIMN